MRTRSQRRPPVAPTAFAVGILVIVIVTVIVTVIVVMTSSALQNNTARTSTTPTTQALETVSPKRLIPLAIAAQSHASSYDREADFGGWIDLEGCRDTRAVVLVRMSAVPVSYTRPNSCTVAAGRWTDPWSGVTTTVAHVLQLDHMVPLANAWRSGAWAWTREQRVAYANDIDDAYHLVPILASENEAKGDNGPEEWKPPNRSEWCTYALAWDRIKAKWKLTATRAEWNTLAAMAATCPS